ncbi:MAG: hypothetical protein PHH23_01760 [Paludibacteraceae bacterium]|nr:hypothetical protein [Paludibacteraceae bacterium]
MRDITIYAQNGDVRFVAPITDSCERVHNLQTENHVSLVFNYDSKTVFLAGDYVVYRGERFSLIEPYYPERKATNHYYYDVKFKAVEEHFIRPIFFRYVSVGAQTWKEPEFYLNANLQTIAEIIIDSLNRANFGVTFTLPFNNTYADTELKALSFSGVNIADAISYIAEQFETEWWIEGGNILHFDKCEYGDFINLSDEYEEVGEVWKSRGVKDVQVSGNSENIPQRVYAYGSERNITRQTTSVGNMNVSYAKRLHLNESLYPNFCIEVPNVTSGIEEVKFFDDIYPRRVGTLGSVRVAGTAEFPIYYVHDNVIPSMFNPRELLIDGCTMMMRFVSGYLNGRDFEVNWHAETDEWEIINQTEDEVQIPMGAFIPRVDDEYVLLNMRMPQVYISLAQQELAEAALKYVEKLSQSVPETTCDSEPTFFREHNVSLNVGSKVQLTCSHFREGILQSRVIQYSHPLNDIYNVSFTLSSGRVTGRLAAIENAISESVSAIDGVQQVTRSISRQSWHNAKEMSEMLDSLVKEMVLVGVEENQFVLTCGISLNNLINTFSFTKGKLVHTVYDGEWVIPVTDVDLANYDDDTPYYVYAKCSKSSVDDALIVLSANKVECEAVAGYYHFLLGILSSKFEEKRVFNETSGLTQIAGGTITTQVIQDANRNLIIDFSSVPPRIIARNGAKISGNIEFNTETGEIVDYNALLARIGLIADETVDNLEIGGRNLLKMKQLNAKNIVGNSTIDNDNSTEIVLHCNHSSWSILPISNSVALLGKNQDFVVSFEYRNADANFGFEGTATSGTAERIFTNDQVASYIQVANAGWKRFSKSFNSGNCDDFGGLNFRGTADVRHIKIEIGTKFTDWTPAPEDIQSDLDILTSMKVGGENLFPIDRVDSFSGLILENCIFSQTVADTRDSVQFFVQIWNDSNLLFNQVKLNCVAGVNYMKFTINESLECTRFRFGINGSVYNNDASFGLNSFGAGGYVFQFRLIGTTQGSVSFTDVQLQKGNMPTSYQAYVKHLTDALNCSTDIAGGLVMTTLLMLRNTLKQVISGMSGLDTDNVAMWSGGDYAKACAAALGNDFMPILLTKAGYGSNVGILSVEEDCIIVEKDGRKVYITTKSIDDSNIVGNPQHLIYNGNISKTLPAGIYTIVLDGFSVTSYVSAYLKKGYTMKNTGGETIVFPAGNVVMTTYVELVFGGETINLATIHNNIVNNDESTAHNQSQSTTQQIQGTSYDRVFSSDTIVRLVIRHSVTPYNCDNTDYGANISSGTYKLTINEERRLTLIGKDGIAVTVGSTNKFTLKEVGNSLMMNFTGKIGERTGNLTVDSNGFVKFS